MLIEFDKAYDLDKTLLSGQAFRWRRTRDADGVRWLTGVIFDNIVKMRQVPEGVEFVCSSGDDVALRPHIKDYLRLSDDLDQIEAAIKRDDCIGAIIARYPGLHILRQEPWECLVSFIYSPQISINRLRDIVENIADEFGSQLTMGNLRRNTFPSPDVLANVGEERLRALGLGRFPNKMAKAVAKAAERVAWGEVDLYALRGASYDEAFKTLKSFKGIGPKVGDCTLLYALDKTVAFPVDVWIKRALRDCYPDVMARKMSDNKMRQWAQDYFGEYAGYAQHWLFYNQPKGNERRSTLRLTPRISRHLRPHTRSSDWRDYV